MRNVTFCFAIVALVAAPAGPLAVLAYDDDKAVTCGSAIKATNVGSGYILFSDEHQLGSGSGQQLITGAADTATPNGLWQVREAHDTDPCEVGTPIRCGEVIRLSHLGTGRNLHTHAINSPLSNQHEVSGYGDGSGEGDTGDDWKVVCPRGRVYWSRDLPFSLQSTATGRFLGVSKASKYTQQNCGRGCPILDHLEAFGRKQDDTYTKWKVNLGVHLYM